jgi:hypothetical protein
METAESVVVGAGSALSRGVVELVAFDAVVAGDFDGPRATETAMTTRPAIIPHAASATARRALFLR